MSGPLLSARGLTKKFGGITANAEISFDLMPGEILGLLGPNGAGKTTLFNLITGYVKPTSGKVTFKNELVTGLAPHVIAQMGLVRTFQLCRPFRGMTVEENLMVVCDGPRLADLSDRAGHIETIIEQVGLADMFKMPVANLSYGSLRRLEIARALCMRPDVVLLDEPFAGLGASEIEQLSQLIRRLHETDGLNIIIIEHKLREFMKLVDRVIVLDFGRIIADEAPDVVVRNPEVIRAYIGGGVDEPA